MSVGFGPKESLYLWARRIELQAFYVCAPLAYTKGPHGGFTAPKTILCFLVQPWMGSLQVTIPSTCDIICPSLHLSIHPPYIILLLNKVKPLALFSTQVRILLPCLCVFFRCLWTWYEYTGSGSEAAMDGIVLRTWEPQAPRGTFPEPSGKTASFPS